MSTPGFGENSDGANGVNISVVRATDGKKCQISIPLSSSLNSLKDAINSNTVLGPLKREQQRIFHLGRELKTGNRSLQALGLGKHGVFLIHLQSLAPKTYDLQSDDEGPTSNGRAEEDDEVIDVSDAPVNRRGRTRQNDNGGADNSSGSEEGIIDITDSSSSRGMARGLQESYESASEKINKRKNQNQEEGVVELLESDSDDDVDVVEVVQSVASDNFRHKRRRQS